MKRILALEEVAQFCICLFAIWKLQVGLNGWMFLFFFVPDIFAVGYLVNKSTGAFMYNFAHHKFIAIVLVITGLFFKQDYIIYAGLLAYAHSSFDRMIGYGLKYPDSPSHTHLGYIGKERFKNKNAETFL